MQTLQNLKLSEPQIKQNPKSDTLVAAGISGVGYLTYGYTCTHGHAHAIVRHVAGVALRSLLLLSLILSNSL